MMYLDRTLRFACSKVARDSLHGRHDGLMQPRSTSLRLLLTECRSPSNDSCLATEIAQTPQKQPRAWHSFRYDKRGDRSSKLSGHGSRSRTTCERQYQPASVRGSRAPYASTRSREWLATIRHCEPHHNWRLIMSFKVGGFVVDRSHRFEREPRLLD